jgi:hypothetical protein
MCQILPNRHLDVSAHLKIFMATLLPPPKRQKVYNGIPEPEKVPVEQSPNVVVQFVSEDDGSALAPAVSLPANVSREDLQSLVNRLTSKVCVSPMSKHHLLAIYSSHITSPQG